MITRGVEDSSDAEPQTLLHDGLRGLIQSSLENVQGPLGLPRSVERHRGGVGKLPVVQQIGVGFHQRHRFVESAAALKGGKSADLASNAGWSALEEIQCRREITLVLAEFAQAARGFWATRHELERLLPVVFRFVVLTQASEAVPSQSKQHWIFGSCGEQRSNQGQSASEVASGQGFVQVQRNSSKRSPHFSPAWFAEACMGCCTWA